MTPEPRQDEWHSISYSMAVAADKPSADVILVIDDEPQIRRVVRNALTDLARKVSEASTAREGLDLAASEQPALIILDLGLPDQDGLEVCHDLRTFTAAPIIVLSARHSDIEKEKLLDAGADDYVTKPFSTLELKARVRAQIRRALAHDGTGRQKAIIDIDGLVKTSRDGL